MFDGGALGQQWERASGNSKEKGQHRHRVHITLLLYVAGHGFETHWLGLNAAIGGYGIETTAVPTEPNVENAPVKKAQRAKKDATRRAIVLPSIMLCSTVILSI